METPPVPTALMNTPPEVLLVALMVSALTSMLSFAPVAPMPVTAESVTSAAMMSVVVELSPSVIAPVRAVSVTLFVLALRPVTAMLPPTMVSSSVKVEESTFTAPVPPATPMVMLSKPSWRRLSSVSSTLSVPAPPPIPMLAPAVLGRMTSAAEPETFPVRSTPSAVIVRLFVPAEAADRVTFAPVAMSSFVVPEPESVRLVTFVPAFSSPPAVRVRPPARSTLLKF